MRTDGLFRLQRVEVKAKPGDTFRFIPFGDIHRDSPSHAGEKWREFLAYAKTVKRPMFLGMGDYLDSFSTSERSLIYNEGIHESSAKRMEQEARGRIGLLSKELSFMRGKCIGMLSGNHYVSVPDGTTGDMLLAQRINAKFLGVCAAIRIVFVYHSRSVAIDIFAHHGKGGGSTAGGRMNAVEKLQTVAEADIFLMGDNHARCAMPVGDRIRLQDCAGTLTIRERKVWIGRTGSFVCGYEPNESSYVVDRALPPSSLGWIEFTFKMNRYQLGTKGNRGDKLDIEIGAVQ